MGEFGVLIILVVLLLISRSNFSLFLVLNNSGKKERDRKATRILERYRAQAGKKGERAR